jgi:hypothetical protein
MIVDSAWDHGGLSSWQWADMAVRLRAGVARRLGSRQRELSSLLDWGKHYLPHHFRRQASGMHVWLSEQLEAMNHHRGAKLNVIGPRGGAKSTLVTLAHVLRVALEGWEPYV